MSHTTTVGSVVVTDTVALASAVEELKREGVGISLLRDSKPRMYYNNQHGVCDYVVRIDNCPYDVGFDKNDDGNYVPVLDTWQNHIQSALGPICPMPNTDAGKAQVAIGRLMQKYAQHAMVNQARNQGYSVERAYTDNDGNVQLVINA